MSEESEIIVECLVCGSHHKVRRDFFKGHEWCEACGQTTNQIQTTNEGE